MKLLKNPLFHVLSPIILAIAVNSIVYLLKYNMNSKEYTKKYFFKLPPGYIIGLVWVTIFGILGYAHYLLYKINNKLTIQCYILELFIIFAVLYPFITRFSEKTGAVLNYVSLLFSFIIALAVMNVSLDIFWYTVPLLLWVSYVNLLPTVIL